MIETNKFKIASGKYDNKITPTLSLYQIHALLEATICDFRSLVVRPFVNGSPYAIG